MPGESFRFIHASDFRLETPLGDLDELPPSLAAAIASAPHDAAARVFEAAEAENIDFLVLSGDLLSPVAAGPRGIGVLLAGFERLHAADTPVFWATGRTDDPTQWPDAVPLPPNVFQFSKTESQTMPVTRAGAMLCNVLGRSNDSKVLNASAYRGEVDDVYTVAVGYGSAEAGSLSNTSVDYWALGGRPDRRVVRDADDTAEAQNYGAAVYAGSPQSRTLGDVGPHGYTVVDVDADNVTRLQFIETDAFRYCRERVDASEMSKAGGIESALSARIGRLMAAAGGRHLIVHFDIAPASGDATGIGSVDALVDQLRSEHGHSTPCVWTASANVHAPGQFPQAWKDEDTILGDFLRAVASRRESGDLMDFRGIGEEHDLDPSILGPLTESVGDPAETLDAATLLGVDLLRGGKLIA